MNEPTSQPPRRYLFALVDGGGTVPPELGTARRLVERGHHVTVLAEDSMLGRCAIDGATFRPWIEAPNRASRHPDDDPYRDWECKSPLALFARLRERQFVGPAPAYAADVTSAIADVRPDLVVCSFFAIGAMAAAEAADVPFDVLFPNAYLLTRTRRSAVRTRAGARQGCTRPCQGPGDHVDDHAAVGQRRARAQRAADVARTRIRSARSSIRSTALAASCVLTSSDFDFPGDVPANVRYVGPILDDPEWANAVGRGRRPPTIGRSCSSPSRPPFRTTSTACSASSTPWPRCRCRRSSRPARRSTRPRIGAAANVTVVTAAPHSAILRRASAVVTHGGHGTVVRALAAGVPMVVLPHGRDQADNARRITSRGAGIALRRSAKPTKIATAVQRLLDTPGYRTAAEHLGEAIRRDAASDTLVRELEDLPSTATTDRRVADAVRAICTDAAKIESVYDPCDDGGFGDPHTAVV